MQLVISATVQEAYDFAAHRLGVPPTSITPVDNLGDDGIPGNEDQIMVHWLPSSSQRRDLHHVSDTLREAEYRRATVTHQAADDWAYTGRRAQVKPEPAPAPNTSNQVDEAIRVAVESLGITIRDRYDSRIARLQRACARYRAELAPKHAPWGDERFDGPEPTDEIERRRAGLPKIVPNDSDRGADEVEAPGRYNQGGPLAPGTTEVVNNTGASIQVEPLTPESAALEQLAEQQEIFAGDEEGILDDLKSRARELGIRVTSQKAPRLREQIAAAEAAQVKPVLSEPPF